MRAAGLIDWSFAPVPLYKFTLLESRPQDRTPGAAFDTWTSADGAERATLHRQGNDYLIRVLGWADFEVAHDGSHVLAWPSPGVAKEDVLGLYTAQILPLAMARQGKLVLHASAVDMDGHAISFVGHSQCGKSTLATVFAQGGHPFLTDDRLLLEVEGDRWFAQPSEPEIRLWRDSRLAVAGGEARLAPAMSHTPKRRLVSLQHCDKRRPLLAIYVLGAAQGSGISIRPLRGVEALHALAERSFALDAAGGEMLARRLDALANLAGRAIHFVLDYPRHYETLAEVRAAVLEHSAGLHNAAYEPV